MHETVAVLPGLIDQVSITGGEPLLSEDTFPLIEEVKRNGMTVCINTNGTFLTEDNCRRIRDLHVERITVSLDSLQPNVNDRLRGKTEEVLHGLERVKDICPDLMVDISAVLSKNNMKSIKGLVDYCVLNGFSLFINPVDVGEKGSAEYKGGVLSDNALQLSAEEELVAIDDVLQYWCKVFPEDGYSTYVENIGKILCGKQPDHIRCQMGTDSYVLDVDGNVYPCFLRKDLCLGNIVSKKFDEILKNPVLRSQRHSLQKAKCVCLGCACLTVL